MQRGEADEFGVDAALFGHEVVMLSTLPGLVATEWTTKCVMGDVVVALSSASTDPPSYMPT